MNNCTDCKSLFVVNKNDKWFRWCCMQFPRPAEYNYVLGKDTADPPYWTCKELRYGMFKGRDCPNHEPGINSLSPDRLGVGPDGSTFEKWEKTMEGRND